MVVLGELLIVGGTAIVVASGIFWLGRLTNKSYCVDRKRIRIILLRSQHLEVTQQISVIKSWQGLGGTLPVLISQKQLANGRPKSKTGLEVQHRDCDKWHNDRRSIQITQSRRPRLLAER